MLDRSADLEARRQREKHRERARRLTRAVPLGRSPREPDGGAWARQARRRSLDSERVEPFVDISALFAAKCPQ